MNFGRIPAQSVEFRHKFVFDMLTKCRSGSEQKVIDVGAGLQRYKPKVEELGYTYYSHDFAGIKPDPTSFPGLQDKSWVYPEQTYTCDILELPSGERFDLVLCTEVLEHVPDPVQAMKKIESLLSPGGYLILTVPLNSLIHQAPFYFSSGLSPYFFEYWCEFLKLQIEELNISGKYSDTMRIEVERIFSSFRLGKPLIELNKLAIKLVADRLSPQIETSSGFNTLLLARKSF
jgi:SAM-dependent methyltransferase